MTKREVAIIAFAVATMLLAVVIVVGRISLPVQQGTRLPRLNGTPPAHATPGNPNGPATQPSPPPSTPTPGSTSGRETAALNPAAEAEDETETEDEPPSAEPGSGGQRLVPLPTHLPLPALSAPAAFVAPPPRP